MRLRGCIAAAVAMLLNGAAVGQQSLAAERVIELVEARECYEAREAINQYLRAATPDVALLTLTGAMFEEGVCLKSSWSRAERLYLRAAETGYKPAMLRLAAGYARPIGGPDVAASLWWAHRARALSENNCAVEAPNDDADAFVAALKGWPAGRVERCAYAAAVLGALMADASFPRAAARREESGRLKVVLWPATGQFELTVLEGTTIRAADPRRWKLSEPHVGKVAGLMDYVQQLSTKAAIGVPVPADAPADWKIGVDLVFVLR